MIRTISSLVVAATLFCVYPQATFAQGVLGNPAAGSVVSGIGLVSGWKCDAERIEVRFDGGTPIEAAYGTSRDDTAGVCGDSDNGYGLLINYNLLGDGMHTVRVFADGEEFANANFEVVTLGTNFLRDANASIVLEDFPAENTEVTIEWQQGIQNFSISNFKTNANNLNGTYELTRISLQDRTQAIADTELQGFNATGEMTISGNEITQVITVDAGNGPTTVVISGECQFTEVAWRCLSTGGTASQPVVVESGTKIVTSLLANTQIGLLNEIDHWRKVSSVSRLSHTRTLRSEAQPAAEAAIGVLGNAAYERLPGEPGKVR